MIRIAAFIVALALLPPPASAQAIKCRDPASGKTIYTDKPCDGGELVVPARTEEEIRRDAEIAAQAREDAIRREMIELERERLRSQETQAALSAQGAARGQQVLIESQACSDARAEASFRAASFGATEEQIRTARYNAALACGQQPPADIVLVQPYAAARPNHYSGGQGQRPPGGGGFAVPITPPAPPGPPARPPGLPARTFTQQDQQPASVGAPVAAPAPRGAGMPR